MEPVPGTMDMDDDTAKAVRSAMDAINQATHDGEIEFRLHFFSDGMGRSFFSASVIGREEEIMVRRDFMECAIVDVWTKYTPSG